MAWVSIPRLKALERGFLARSPEEVGNYQLDRLNHEWAKAVRSIPYYVSLAEKNALPGRFASLREFVEAVPPLTREVLQQRDERYWHDAPRPNHRRTTGGSTASPIQMPAWRREFRHTRLDPWLGRSWFGVSPRDRLFLFWGHSHLLGEGWRGRVNAWVRAGKDRLQNYVRYSAYDMSEPALRKGLERLQRSQPDFVIGYSRYLDELARTAEDWGSPSRALSLKAVIAAAEEFPAPDSRDQIESLFGAPVGMEYGAVETGLIAHSRPEGDYRVFWHNYLLEYHGEGRQEVFVTSLFPRCTPLFRYRLGDHFELGESAEKAADCSVLSFERVVGRSNLAVTLPSGRTLHSESISHIARGQPKVLAYQFLCAPDGVTLRLRIKGPLDDHEVASIRRLAGLVDPQLGAALQVVTVANLERTLAGKTPMVIVDPALTSARGTSPEAT
ncbi:MAG: hypothetical protein OXG82_22690 [Gammaproteobacteria bacterium]|nr:hypothetical protein [Gammaproteobacteria bacterium]